MINVKGRLISVESILYVCYQNYNHTRNRYIVFQYRNGIRIEIEVDNYKEYEDICNRILKTLEGGKE